MRSYSDAIKHYLRNPVNFVKQTRLWLSHDLCSVPFLFVIGPPRSGTTLVQRILLNHNKIVGYEEETAIFSFRSIYDFERFRHFLDKKVYENAVQKSSSVAEFFATIHKMTFALPDDGYFCEKTPQHAKYLKYLISRFPSSKFLFCVRDPRDAYCSAKASGVILQSGSVIHHAKYFNSCSRDLIALKSCGKGEDILLVKYEDLTKAPRDTVGSMMSFIGLEANIAVQLNPQCNIGDVRAARSEFMRLGENITAKTVGRWYSEMSRGEALKYQAVAGASMAFFGYACLS